MAVLFFTTVFEVLLIALIPATLLWLSISLAYKISQPKMQLPLSRIWWTSYALCSVILAFLAFSALNEASSKRQDFNTVLKQLDKLNSLGAQKNSESPKP